MTRPVTVAAVQSTPAFLDRDASLERVLASVKEAAALGSQLIVFPEAVICGYPEWVWRLPAWTDHALYEQLHDQAVDIPGPVIDALGDAARDAGAWLVVGVTERTRSGTLHNSLVYLSPDGRLANVHRKLVATGPERLVWGPGDGSTLDTVDTALGRIGGLICWENLMPLARAALYEQGVDLYVAPTWDHSDAWLATLKHIAREGRVFVVGTCSCIHTRDVAADDGALAAVYGEQDKWMSPGGSAIVAPDGTVVVGPLYGEGGILTATIDLDDLVRARREFDPVGHYARPDVFRLSVDRRGPGIGA